MISQVTATSEDAVDCIVVGCGASGLAAALTLAKNGQRVTVLEARARYGGRINNKFGAAFIGLGQHKLLEYMNEYGLERDPVYDEGYMLVEQVQGKPTRMTSGGIPRMRLMSLLKLQSVIATLDRASLEIDVESPWESEHAAFWDALEPLEFLDLLLGKERYDDVKETVVIALKPIYGVDVTLSKMSMLWLLAGIKSNGGFRTLIDVKNGAQEFNMKGSFQVLIDSMAEQFGRERIYLDQQVESIRVSQGGGKGVEVQTKSGGVFTAKRCIVSLQPGLYDTIEVYCKDDGMWQQKLALCEQFQRVERRYTKVFLKYAEPWWRNAGYSGQIGTNYGPASWFYDYSKDGAYVLGAMVTDSLETREWHRLSKLERKDKVVQQLQRVYQGVKRTDGSAIAAVLHYDEFMWPDERFSNGCVPSLPPGSLDQWRALNTSLDDVVFFAGTALASKSTGYVDGALLSGESAATRALASLNIVAKPAKSSANSGWLSCCTGSNVTPWAVRKLFGESTDTLVRRKARL